MHCKNKKNKKNINNICISQNNVVPLQAEKVNININSLNFTKMKKTIFSIVCAVALALGMTSCGAIGIVGGIYQDTTTPEAVTANALGSKVGQADVLSILGVVALGDAGVQKAAKQAGITKVSHVDKKTFSILGVYTKVTYTVYGN
jgi:hypothetical protein